MTASVCHLSVCMLSLVFHPIFAHSILSDPIPQSIWISYERVRLNQKTLMFQFLGEICCMQVLFCWSGMMERELKREIACLLSEITIKSNLLISSKHLNYVQQIIDIISGYLFPLCNKTSDKFKSTEIELKSCDTHFGVR